MPRLSAARSANALAAPLPINNSYLNKQGVVLRRNQFSMLAAAPGVGKSLVASNIAVRTQVPITFFSADSDEWTVKTRCASIITGFPLEQVEEMLNEGGKSEAWILNELRKADHIDWCYRTDIDLDFIARRVKASAECMGEYPGMIIVDNLGNTVEDQNNEYAELRGTCRELQTMCRITGAHVLALHHVNGPKEDGYDPIGLGDLQGKLGKIPEVVLGLNRVKDDPDLINLTVPKQRLGRSGMHIKLPINYASAFIGGWRP